MAEPDSDLVVRETPQVRALITVAMIHRLFGDIGGSGAVLAEGMRQARLLVNSDLRIHRQYDALVRIFREAQARDVEWCAVCVGGAARPGAPDEAALALQAQAARVRLGEGEMDESAWPARLRSLAEETAAAHSGAASW